MYLKVDFVIWFDQLPSAFRLCYAYMCTRYSTDLAFYIRRLICLDTGLYYRSHISISLWTRKPSLEVAPTTLATFYYYLPATYPLFKASLFSYNPTSNFDLW